MLSKILKRIHPNRPAGKDSRQNSASLTLAERRARAMAPTVFCPPARVEQCVREAVHSRIA